ISPTVNLQTAANQLQANVRAGLKILLSSRIQVVIGGNLDYNNPSASQLARKGLITPDITIEWLLSKDGSLRVVGFNRTSADYTIGQRNRSGIQLSYRKDFNRLSDIFSNRKKRIEQDSLKNEIEVKEVSN
ncbi:MAG: translocation/assembly module TamB domain-containing protein, partial [Ferruginibacter sp.]